MYLKECTGRGVRVAVIDSGVHAAHPHVGGVSWGLAIREDGSISDDDVVEAVRLGARGVVLKESSPETLLECVRRVYRGEQWIDREMMTRAFGHATQREAAMREASRILTPREIEIVRMIAQGLRNRVIAERLSISEGTVKKHIENIFNKTGATSRVELLHKLYFK